MSGLTFNLPSGCIASTCCYGSIDLSVVLNVADQSRAMEVAILAEWPKAAHRWCKWHVLRRVRECVGPKYTKNKEFRDRFHKMLNEMLTVEEFEAAWSALLKDYNLEKNPFLTQVYDIRKKWVKAYFNGVFCAKQTSTQRSESANHMVKGLVPPSCSINHFVRQYAKLQHTIDDAENYEEKRTKLVSSFSSFLLNLVCSTVASTD